MTEVEYPEKSQLIEVVKGNGKSQDENPIKILDDSLLTSELSVSVGDSESIASPDAATKYSVCNASKDEATSPSGASRKIKTGPLRSSDRVSPYKKRDELLQLQKLNISNEVCQKQGC